MSEPMVHIINHTHWDREWFLSSVYTTEWIPGLIESLEKLGAANPQFRYFFDGQTLVIEDLLAAYPAYADQVADLIEAGTLTIGPYYCQPDWKLTCGESLIRNLQYGQADGAQFGAPTQTGWLVDTFGHISQAPQIHHLFGIDSVYVWRGVPELVPYFEWVGADGATLFGVDLFGGYRNLYGVTHAPEVAETRLHSEIQKLSPFYPTPDIPLFDGYDLEDNPEDPLLFYQSLGVTEGLVEATPHSFVTAVSPKLNTLPTLHGELNSGKYGATFPGVYSSRTYTKVLNRDCAHLLYQLAEPLGVMAWLKGRPYPTQLYERCSRLLLQNGVHDVICGVSIDQVHEKMVDIYRHIYEDLEADVALAIDWALRGFSSGIYAISTNPFAQSGTTLVDGTAYRVETSGVGVWPVTAVPQPPAEQVSLPTFFENEYFTVKVDVDGTIGLPDGRLGQLVLFAEHGDAYSDETGEQLGRIEPTSVPICERQGERLTVRFDGRFEDDGVWVETAVTIQLDDSELIRWQVDLDSGGVGFRVELLFDSGLEGVVWAGMPFDVVKRPFVDDDLLPRDVGDDMAKIFMGQRELNAVRSFPFHEFVALAGAEQTALFFAKGINCYRAYEDGRVALTLRRSVEWVTKANLENRIGDAGPFFYVPDGRCERMVRHEVAFALCNDRADSMGVQRLNKSFQNEPLLIHWRGDGDLTSWSLLGAEMPLSSLQVVDEQVVGRWFNPTGQDGEADGQTVEAKKILETAVPLQKSVDPLDEGVGEPLIFPRWRVGRNHGLPDPDEVDKLWQKVAELETAVAQAKAAAAQTEGDAKLKQQHQMYVYEREMLEATLSATLNERKLAMNGKVNDAYLYERDDEVAEIGWQLNQLRIKRRIFDYVVAALE